MYKHDGKNITDLNTLVASPSSGVESGYMCTYKNCGVLDQIGIKVQHKNDPRWCGAFLCSEHARELQLLW